jgi:excisionase family DNA binding protein
VIDMPNVMDVRDSEETREQQKARKKEETATKKEKAKQALAKRRSEIEPEWLDAERAGKLISISGWKIREMVRNGILRAHCPPGSTRLMRFKREDVLALMAPREQRTASA